MSEIHYWNRAHFEGLASLSSALRLDLRLERLAAYCDLREKGLRGEAFAELEAFLAQASRWERQVQRDVALHVLEAHWKTPGADTTLAYPLRKKFLERILEEWRSAETDNPVPVRYLALLHRDRTLLDDALQMNPRDDVVRAGLARVLIEEVEYATHHLVEGTFIGDEGKAAAALVEARSILANMTDASSVGSLQQDLEAMAALLADWREYQQRPEGTFPAWCRARNRTHHWWSIVYYDGGAA